MEKESKGGFAYALLVIIRLLMIVLLCVMIYSAVQGALMIKEIRDTASVRMQNGDFPIPMGGIAEELGGVVASQLGAQVDSELQPYVDSLQKAFEQKDYVEVRRQLAVLDARLAEQGMTDAQKVNQQLMQAIDRGDTAAIQRLSMQLIGELQK